MTHGSDSDNERDSATTGEVNGETRTQGPEWTRAKLSAFFEQSPYMAGMLDLEGRVTDVNDLALRVSNRGREEFIGKPFWETPWWAGAPESQRAIRDAFPAVLSGEVFQEILPCEVPGRGTRQSDFVMKQVTDGDGRPLFVTVLGQDVTERLSAEADLADAAKRMALASDAAHFGTFRVDIPSGKFWLSPELCKLVGLKTVAFVPASRVQELIDPRDLPAVSEAVKKAAGGPGERSFECEFRLARTPPEDLQASKPPDAAGTRKRRTSRWMLVRGRALADQPKGSDGGPVLRGITGAVLDVTARRRSERKLAQSQQITRLALEAAGMGTWVADHGEGRVWRDATTNALNGLPAEPSELSLEASMEEIHPDDAAVVREAIQRAIATKDPFTIEFRRRFKDGSYRWFESRATPADDGEHDSRWIGTTADVTERKRSEELLRDAVLRAEAASRAKSEFVANMSHEIRTPMTSVLGYTDLLLESETDTSRANHLQRIRRNGEMLLGLINDILDLSKIEAGRMELLPVRVDLEDLLFDVRSMVEVRAVEKNLTFIVEYGADVPRYVCTDPMRVRQVLVNLLGNAVKFTKFGGVHLRVQRSDQPRLTQVGEVPPFPIGSLPRAEEDGTASVPHVRFDVIDTGVGIGEAQQRRLFVPFVQADTSVSRDFGGTGLGLAICQRLATILGGTIDFESTLGRGSRFSLILPCDAPAEAPFLDADYCKPRQERPPESGGSDARLECRVLVVDDQPDIRFLTKTLLNAAGSEVHTAIDGVDALTKVSEHRTDFFDIILMDMQMPRLSGYEAAAKLREDGFRGPIVALTAEVMHGDMDRCLESGCDTYLPKPIDATQLVGTVRRFVAGA